MLIGNDIIHVYHISHILKLSLITEDKSTSLDLSYMAFYFNTAGFRLKP